MSAAVILVGGGLANSLIAWRLHQRAPRMPVTLIEQGDVLGGNHTWCFHASDVTPAQLEWLAPLVTKSWPGYDIHFPARVRHIDGGYHCITSAQLHAVIAGDLGEQVVLNTPVSGLQSTSVELADGNRLEASLVIDGRGDPGGDALEVAYQKFLGQVVRIEGGHGLRTPILMDATVAQLDGFRFMYTLPLAEDCLLIEDTRYSNGPDLERTQMRNEIGAYAKARNWMIESVLREEEGVLPVVIGGDMERLWSEGPGIPRSGIRAGLFHYTTGYSLPEAVRLADAIGDAQDLTSAALYDFIRARSRTLWRRGGFFRLLNRMLFHAAAPAERYRVLEHFYRLPTDVVNRFYAGKPTVLDRLRILSGKPPVPVSAALASVAGRRQ